MKISVLAVLGLILGSAWSARADIVWERDYNVASAKADASGKPLFIDFYTDWCGWCKKLDADVYSDPQVQQLSTNFVMLKLDAEKEGQPQAQYFGVTGFPTLIFLGPQGQPLTKIPGYIPAKEFVRVMGKVLQRVGTPKTAPPTAPKATASFRPNARGAALRQQVMLRRATSGGNQSGVMLLDENGAVPLAVSVKKSKTPAKSAKNARKVPGY